MISSISNKFKPIGLKERMSYSFQSFSAFLIPVCLGLQFNVVGQLYLTEIIFLLIFPITLLFRYQFLKNKDVRNVILWLFFWLTAQIAVDFITNNTFENYSRGWSKIFFFILNFAIIRMLLGLRERFYVVFFLGLSIGLFLEFFHYFSPSEIISMWKMGPGQSFLCVITGALILFDIRGYKLFLPWIYMALALLAFFFGARSLAGSSFLAAFYLLGNNYVLRNKIDANRVSLWKKLQIILLGVVAILCITQTYKAGASSGFFGAEVQRKYYAQDLENAGPVIGRGNFTQVTNLIEASPVIGYGSWMYDRGYFDKKHLPDHSIILNSWLETGILGVFFWLYILWFAGKTLIDFIFIRSNLTPIVAFLGIGLIWDILFSPFGGSRRVTIPFDLLLFIFAKYQMLQSKKQNKDTNLSARGL